MFDALLRPLINRPLNSIGRRLARYGVSANTVTLTGIAVGLSAGVAIAHCWFTLGFALIVVNRLLDGLDGAIARATQLTDFGGYLDIVGDFVFYLSIPVGFGIAAPENLIPALILGSGFALTGISFLAFAVLAAKHGLQTSAHGPKSFFYSTGLAEGTETIIVLLLMTAMPNWFGTIASIYSLVCLLTVIQRTIFAYKTFGPDGLDR